MKSKIKNKEKSNSIKISIRIKKEKNYFFTFFKVNNPFFIYIFIIIYECHSFYFKSKLFKIFKKRK